VRLSHDRAIPCVHAKEIRISPSHPIFAFFIRAADTLPKFDAKMFALQKGPNSIEITLLSLRLA
jgi:hypothetical protein